MTEKYQARAKSMLVNNDLDQLEPGELFEVTWSFTNEGTAVWDERYKLVYAAESHPDAIDYPHTNLAAMDAIPFDALGAAPRVAPGDTVYLTLSLTAPEQQGMYITGWQLQATDGERFGPLREIRIIVVPPTHKGLGDPAYEFESFANSLENINSTLAGEAFSAAWTIRNASTEPMTGDYRVAYFGEDPGGLNFIPSRMGAEESYALRDMIGKDSVAPDETVKITLNLKAPEEPGLYRFRWQMLDAGGTPFGGVRWMGIVVARENGTAPPEPVETSTFTPSSVNVIFFTGIHGPADDWRWGDNDFKNLMGQLNMPVFFMSHGSNPDNGGFGDPNKNIVRLVWNPNTRDANKAYEEISNDALRNWYNRGYRRFLFFNEPQFGMAIAGIEEGMGIAWDNATEFARFLRTCLVRARQDWPGIKLYNTPMSTNAAFNPWHWRNEMWNQVKGHIDGWCMHAYSGNNSNADVAAKEIADQVIEVQRAFKLNIPIVVSEASVNRGNDAAQKARVAFMVAQRLAGARGVEGVFWYAADWSEGMDKYHEGWYRNGIGAEYIKQRG